MKKMVLSILLSLPLLCAQGVAQRGGHGGGGHSHSSSSSGSTSSKSSKSGKAGGATNPEIVHVKGYDKKSGKHVKEHDRTKGNDTDLDNWSTVGNVNPETGKKGTKKHKH